MTSKNNVHLRERLVHERDAADMLGLSVAWMQKARYLGTGPAYIRVGGLNGRAVRYRVRDIEAYIEDNSVATSKQLNAAGSK